MRAIELLTEAAPIGREYQHFEDLLIVNGAAGGIEALEELKDSLQNPQSMNLKWDGQAAVFWGRNEKGVFTFAPANQWAKGQFLTREGLENQIKTTGRQKPGQSPEEFAAIRSGLAAKYVEIWDIFERATPKAFRGYVNGDLMFTEKQTLQGNEYEFTPNKVTYYVKKNGLFGKMPTARVFVAAHGMVANFGAEVTGNIKPVSDAVIEQFNKTPDLIVLNTLHPSYRGKLNTAMLDKAVSYIKSNAGVIDELVNFTAPKFTTLKNIMYTYAIARGKTVGGKEFAQWLETSKVSPNQQAILQELMKKPEWKIFWTAFDNIVNAKHAVFDELEKATGEDLSSKYGIRAAINGEPGGEGVVKGLRSGTLGKIVNPRFRTAPPNPRFVPEV